MWWIFMTVLVLLAIGSAWYLTAHFHRFPFVEKLGRRRPVLAWTLSFLPVGLISCFSFINITAMIVVVLHFILIWMLCDLVAFFVRKIFRRTFSYTVCGLTAIALTVIYLSVGWYMAHHVFQTSYSLESEKDLGRDRLRVVEIADAHLGITLDGEGFAAQMARIQALQPDLVVIAGDFVDDDTPTEDMTAACAALGDLETTYGVYFVFGNHDEGYFNYRKFSSQKLREVLTENRVVILEDESVLVSDNVYLIGRKDRSSQDRMDMERLTAELDQSKYMILLDHQPNDYDSEAAAGVDLVLSGHTHGGHIFPAGLIGLAMKANDRVYGTERRDGTDFVVTSGISGWAIPFKTGTFSEFVVIDIQ